MEPSQPSDPPIFGDELRRAITSLWRVMAVVGVASCFLGLLAAILAVAAFRTPIRLERNGGMGLDLAIQKDAADLLMFAGGGGGLGITLLWSAVIINRQARAQGIGEDGLAVVVWTVVQLMVWPTSIPIISIALVKMSFFAAQLMGYR